MTPAGWGDQTVVLDSSVRSEVEHVLFVISAHLKIALGENQFVADSAGVAMISPEGATIMLLPSRWDPSSHPTFATPTTQVLLW